MAQAYVPIQTVTVGSGGAASIDFTNIPGTYTDLLVFYSTRAATTGSDMGARFNGDTGSNYSYRKLGGNGSVTSSDTASSQTSLTRIGRVNPSSTTASTFSNNYMYIPNYTSSNNKSVLMDGVSENNATSANVDLIAGLWSNSAAITSISLLIDGGGNFAQHSTATLYGIGGARASGGTITADARYTYHTFTSTGTFTALEKIKGAEVLCIAGGGGATNGSGEGSGGGGAGGVLYVPYTVLNSGTSYTVAVGSGGTGTAFGSNPTKGSNSSVSNAIADGGGASKSESFTTASDRNGGSGGGGGGNGGGYTAGTTTQGNVGNGIGYGYNGGTGYYTNPYTGGGGGGAGGAGSAATSTVAGNGGIGTSLFSAWGYATGTGVSVGGIYYYAGGGAGGNLSGSGAAATGGSGGGGNGGKYASSAVQNQPTAGTANTGGGAGGGANQTNYVNGGSGLVIIRYPN